jgi:CheY-like chemotaxis protein
MTAANAPVLVVDDDEDIREVVAMALSELGYAVDTAADGAEALRRLEIGPRPSMVLLDMMMPRMDGETVVRKMRAHPALADIPVVLLSGHSGARQIADSLHLAATLVKPIELAELQETVARVAGPS